MRVNSDVRRCSRYSLCRRSPYAQISAQTRVKSKYCMWAIRPSYSILQLAAVPSRAAWRTVLHGKYDKAQNLAGPVLSTCTNLRRSGQMERSASVEPGLSLERRTFESDPGYKYRPRDRLRDGSSGRVLTIAQLPESHHLPEFEINVAP